MWYAVFADVFWTSGAVLCTLHQDYWMFNKVQQLQYTSLSEFWKGRVESLDVDGTLEQSYGGMVIGMLKSTIEYQKAVMGCSARVKFGKSMETG